MLLQEFECPGDVCFHGFDGNGEVLSNVSITHSLEAVHFKYFFLHEGHFVQHGCQGAFQIIFFYLLGHGVEVIVSLAFEVFEGKQFALFFTDLIDHGGAYDAEELGDEGYVLIQCMAIVPELEKAQLPCFFGEEGGVGLFEHVIIHPLMVFKKNSLEHSFIAVFQRDDRSVAAHGERL